MLDPRIPDGLTAIREGWSLDDLTHAVDLLEELDAADARARAAQQIGAHRG